MLGGAVAGALAGMAGVRTRCRTAGRSWRCWARSSGVPMFFVAVVVGSVVTALTTVVLVDVRASGRRRAAAAGADVGLMRVLMSPHRAPGGRRLRSRWGRGRRGPSRWCVGVRPWPRAAVRRSSAEVRSGSGRRYVRGGPSRARLRFGAERMARPLTPRHRWPMQQRRHRPR